ncbi:hypothetical protein L1987_48121 [Smallanthus sonchifolius]|uniref:Uncharacterized protein n=1 Tax=Smallanthus sonchifolius TaxID=185202 RepID=A0ACB9FS66_9ASTR|nr:hypothetical protein L1987_48121 [Smallanthus sonchifolius]
MSMFCSVLRDCGLGTSILDKSTGSILSRKYGSQPLVIPPVCEGERFMVYELVRLKMFMVYDLVGRMTQQKKVSVVVRFINFLLIIFIFSNSESKKQKKKQDGKPLSAPPTIEAMVDWHGKSLMEDQDFQEGSNVLTF